MVGTCIEKLYKGKKIVAYKIKFRNGSTQCIESKQLKCMKEQGLIHIDNLKFTQDGRLIDMKTPWEYSDKMERMDTKLGEIRESLIEKIMLITDRVAVCNFTAARRDTSGDGYADAFYMKFDQLKEKQIQIMGDFVTNELGKNPNYIFKPNPYGELLSGGTLKCKIKLSNEKNRILNLEYIKAEFNAIGTFTSRLDTNKVITEVILNNKINHMISYLASELKQGTLDYEDFKESLMWLYAIIIYKEIVNYKLDLSTVSREKYNKHLNKHIIDTLNSVSDSNLSIVIVRVLQSANL